MKHFWMIGCAVAVMACVPAQAQLLGGGGLGGGLGGNLGGNIGGTLGGSLDRPARDLGSTVERKRKSVEANGTASGDARARKQVDSRQGRVAADGGGNAGGTGNITGSTGLLGQSAGSSAAGSGSGGASGGANANLIGTDQAGTIARGGIGRARDSAGTARDVAGQKVGRVRGVTGHATDSIGSAANFAGSAGGGAAGSGAASANGAGGSAAGNGALAGAGDGGLTALPGMPITNARGRTLGFVQGVRTTSSGAVETVLVDVGNKVVPIPASQFSGNGEILVTGMTSGQLKSAAKDAPQADQADQSAQ
ncbi:hypothetical protein [Blastomonas sp.]|uniref:hypothetical protein n=1 Tax=Blastomonas sp. TaxID=1909299 RepID=UPI0035937895